MWRSSSTANANSIELSLMALLAEGHLLIEDVPGSRQDQPRQGARGLDRLRLEARTVSRPTCCPPTSSASASTNARPRSSGSQAGPLFANIVLADEINRASPKTQSALLEAMEERQVTVDGTTRALPPPFMVIATQNPIEQEGTYRLPESQLDRFLLAHLARLPRTHGRDRDPRRARLGRGPAKSGSGRFERRDQGDDRRGPGCLPGERR